MSVSGLKVCFVAFWPSFSPQTGVLGLVLQQALGQFEIVPDPVAADVIVRSIFAAPELTLPFARKTIAVIWENQRPDYRAYAYSLSSDFDSYGGRNQRLPYWYGELAWPRLRPDKPGGPPFNHAYEPPADIGALLQPRAAPEPRSQFCCFVANNPEQHRRLALEALSTIGGVDIYGAVVNKPLQASKYTVLTRYRYALAFENSLFPGYYTEKPLHAWVAGCVPLYFADRWCAHDFNPQAMINRADFPSVADFVRHVQKIDRDPAAYEAIVTQPFLTRRPTLDPVIDFVRKAAAQIVNRAPPRLVPAAPAPSSRKLPGLP